jgi:chaperone required for assembly of F1-ATPase
MKRFWDTASVAREAGRFTIRLDGRSLRMPGATDLALASEPLAAAIAAEWQAAGGCKGGDFVPEDLPLTRLAATARERISPDPAPTIDALARYGDSDLLCYRATFPPELASRQATLWQPWLDRAARLHGAALRVVHGVMPHAQPPKALSALRSALAAQTNDVLAGLGVLVPATGSLVLGLALADGALSAAAAVDLAFLDEDFQAEHWGEDAQAIARRARVAEDVAFAVRYIELSNSVLF